MKCGAGCMPTLERGARQSCSDKCERGMRKTRISRRVSCWPAGCWSLPHSHRGAHSPDDHGAVPVSLASGTRHKTLEKCAGCGRVTSESDQPTGGGVASWEITLWVDDGAAHAASTRGQLGALDRQRVGTWWRVWGMLKDEIGPMITGALFWKEDAWAACLKVLVERPRRRTLQRLPPEALDVCYRCEARKQEGMPIAA